MKKRECVEERFLDDVKSHQMKIIRDEDEYRHIRFKRPGSGSYYFDLITWPGHLCFTGDMGTQVFSRVRDMFTFFREDQPDKPGMSINPSYWGEKLQSVGRFGGYEEFDEALFREALREDFDMQHEEKVDDVEWMESAWQEVEEDILEWLDDNNNEFAAVRLVMDFDSEYGTEFNDFYEHNVMNYTFHYIWCCFAMVWGIGVYDKHKAQEAADAENGRRINIA